MSLTYYSKATKKGFHICAKLITIISAFFYFFYFQLLSLSNQVEANTKAINLLLKSNENREKDTEDKLSHCDSELLCIRKDLNNFNQVNKDFLEVVKRTMGSFDESINGVKGDLEFKLKEFRCEKKNSDWSLKMDIEAKLDKFECSVEATNNKVSLFLNSRLDCLQIAKKLAAFFLSLQMCAKKKKGVLVTYCC